MQIIVGTHEEKTGRKDGEGKPILQTVVDTVNMTDEPRVLSDIPEKAIHPDYLRRWKEEKNIGPVLEDGTVNVVLVDGKKFRVRPEGARKPAPTAAAEK